MIGGLDVYTNGATATIDFSFSIQLVTNTAVYIKISSSSSYKTYVSQFFVQIIIYNPIYTLDKDINYQFFDGSIMGNNTNYAYFYNGQK